MPGARILSAPDSDSTSVPAVPRPSADETVTDTARAGRRGGTAGGDSVPSAFGATQFDLTPTPPAAAAAPFDVCHVGVVLRTAGFVLGTLAIVQSFVAAAAIDWLPRLAVTSVAALAGVLLWLAVSCALRRVLAQCADALQTLVAALLGAACGAVAGAVGVLLVAAAATPAVPERTDFAPVGPSALAGLAFALLVAAWLRLRARAQGPADATARLAELQSRIRPHFLFNTLNTALSLVRLDPARAEAVLEDLAELFRVALTDSGESVSLGEEVELAQRYLAIEQIRFGDRLQVHWELDPDAAHARVPPLLLQPLVENAVRHGVEPAPEGGVIRVRTRVKLGRAVVSIANTVADGPSRPGHGMALQNVHERLRLMHDMASQFETRREGSVFRVQLAVPL